MLVFGTGMVESHYNRITQIGGGPALSFWAIEPATHKLVKAFLNHPMREKLKERILAASYLQILPPDEVLLCNMRYAILICRLVYASINVPLPAANDAKALSEYHKKWYNTRKGKADAVKNTEVFKGIINGTQG